MPEPSENLQKFITRTGAVRFTVDVSKSFTINDTTLVPDEDYEIGTDRAGYVRYRYLGVACDLEILNESLFTEHRKVIGQPIFCKYFTTLNEYESGVSFFLSYEGCKIKPLVLNYRPLVVTI